MFEGAFGVGNHGKTRSMMAGDFGELPGRDGARRAWRGKDDFRGVGEKEAGDFVNGLIPESGGERVQGVLQLEAAGKAWADFEAFSGIHFNDARENSADFHGFAIDAKKLRRLDDRAAETLGASQNNFAGFRMLFGEDEGHARLQDSCFFGSDFFE